MLNRPPSVESSNIIWSWSRSFMPGDEVLVLLPVSGSSLSARFFGPYVIKKKISETDYMIHTPDRKCQTRVCHINMLKAYNAREKPMKRRFVT